MKYSLQDLASMVAVRNHIIVLLNDRNITKKKDYEHLNGKRNEIDKMFVSALLEVDINSLFSDSKTSSINLEEWVKSFEETKKTPEFNAFTSKVAKEVEKLDKDEVQLELPLDKPPVPVLFENTVDSIELPDDAKEITFKQTNDGLMAVETAHDNNDASKDLSDDAEFKKRLAEEKKAVSKKKSTKKKAKATNENSE